MFSHTIPFSVHKAVEEPIQQNKAFLYKRWLRWNSQKILLQQSTTHY